jgi:signal-transduction protein with cAMP-binding, CBS, and nucleotidyltransferase domain
VDGDVIHAKTYSEWWATKRVCDLPISTPLTITSDVKCKDAIRLLKQEGFDMVPVLEDNGTIVGVVTEGNMTSRLLSRRCEPDSTVAEAGTLCLWTVLTDLFFQVFVEAFSKPIVLTCHFDQNFQELFTRHFTSSP